MAAYRTTDGTTISDIEFHHETERQLFTGLVNPEMIKSFLNKYHPELAVKTIPENLMDEFRRYVFDTVHDAMKAKYTCVD